jgi:hypothetical protein
VDKGRATKQFCFTLKFNSCTSWFKILNFNLTKYIDFVIYIYDKDNRHNIETGGIYEDNF